MSDATLALEGAADALLVLVAGDALPQVAAVHGEFADWIERAASSVWTGPWTRHDLRSEVPPPDGRSFAGVIISGSAASVTERAPWMLRAEAYIRTVVEQGVPLFGICFGHQLMAQALGGEVRNNPRGREIGTVKLSRTGDDPLFAGLADTLAVNATHVDTVALVPPEARVVATTALEENAIIDFGPFARGVQFHPEIDGAVMRGYIEVRRPLIVEEGLDADALHAEAVDTPDGRALLENFIREFVRSPARRAA
jgi:GMP synthase (glutamine-hydrolysing)